MDIKVVERRVGKTNAKALKWEPAKIDTLRAEEIAQTVVGWLFDGG